MTTLPITKKNVLAALRDRLYRNQKPATVDVLIAEFTADVNNGRYRSRLREVLRGLVKKVRAQVVRDGDEEGFVYVKQPQDTEVAVVAQ